MIIINIIHVRGLMLVMIMIASNIIFVHFNSRFKFPSHRRYKIFDSLFLLLFIVSVNNVIAASAYFVVVLFFL